MCALSVQLNGLNVGTSFLGSQQISPEHKTRAELNLSRIFSEHSSLLLDQKNPFSLSFGEEGKILKFAGQDIGLKKSSELKRIQRIVRFHQHTGQLPRTKLSASDLALIERLAHKTIGQVNLACIPGANGKLLAGMRIADNTLTMTRNFLYATPGVGPRNPLVNNLGYYAGMFWSFFAFRELDGGWAEYKQSDLIGDPEGLRRAKIRLLSGAICTTASLTYLAGRVCDSLANTAASSAIFHTANAVFGLGSFLAMGSSLLGVLRCNRFNKRLNEYLEHPNLSQVERLKGALLFLKDELSATPEERLDLIQEIDQNHPDWSPEQKEKYLQQKLADLTEVKVKYMKRRTSNRSLYLIATQADELLAKLSDPKTRNEGIKDATILIHTIQQENKTKVALYSLGFLAALLSFIAMLVGTILSLGALPFILYGIAGTIYLSMTLYTTGGSLINTQPQLPIIPKTIK
jgi:hypothetical protein